MAVAGNKGKRRRTSVFGWILALAGLGGGALMWLRLPQNPEAALALLGLGLLALGWAVRSGLNAPQAPYDAAVMLAFDVGAPALVATPTHKTIAANAAFAA